MSRKPCIQFNPALGVKYLLKDLLNNETVIGRTLSNIDEIHMPIRSNRSSNIGEEFFKMYIGDEVYVFLNSINHDKCISSDGRYEFTGIRPNGKIGCISRNKNNRPRNKTTTNIITFKSKKLSYYLKENK